MRITIQNGLRPRFITSFFKSVVGWQVLLSVSFFFTPAAAQNKIDSLTKLIESTSNDSLKVAHRFMLSFYYLQVDAPKGLELAKMNLKEAQRLNSKSLIGGAYNSLGTSYSFKGDYDSSIWAYQNAIRYITNRYRLSDLYLNMGITYEYEGRFEESLKAYFKSLELANEKDSYYILSSIANTYRLLKNFRQAAHYDTIAIAQGKKMNCPESVFSLLEGNYAETLVGLNRLSEARKILLRVVKVAERQGDKFYLANHYKALGDIEKKSRRYDDAHRYYSESLRLNKEVGSQGDMAKSLYLLADLNLLRNHIAEAEALARRALNLTDSLKLPVLRKDITTLLAKGELVKQNFGAYLYYDSISRMLTDSLNLQEQSKVVSELKTRYETEKKENENVLLRQKQLSQELVVKNQQYVIVLVSGSLIAVIVFLVIFYQNNKRARKTNEELTVKNVAILNQKAQIQQQNQEIETKNQELQLRIEEIQHIQDQLIQSEKMASLGQMTAGIAHEINNPLNFISGGVQGLSYSYKEVLEMLQNPQTITPDKLKEVDTDANALFNALKNGVDRVSKIINSLRSFSSPQKAEHVDTRLEDVMEMALTLLTPKIKEFNVQVERHYPEAGCVASVNAIQISQVFVNLIDNAIQAMESVKGPRMLKIKIARVQDSAEVRISDTGMGIAPADQKHVMEPFFTTKPVGKGTGLGLSISYSIIESHQGKIRFESEVGKGTTFIIELPCNSAQQ